MKNILERTKNSKEKLVVKVSELEETIDKIKKENVTFL